MFYCFQSCKEFIRTIPLLQHDEHKVEDLDTSLEDHIADEWRYCCMKHVLKGSEIPEIKDKTEWRLDPLNQFTEE